MDDTEKWTVNLAEKDWDSVPLGDLRQNAHRAFKVAVHVPRLIEEVRRLHSACARYRAISKSFAGYVIDVPPPEGYPDPRVMEAIYRVDAEEYHETCGPAEEPMGLLGEVETLRTKLTRVREMADRSAKDSAVLSDAHADGAAALAEEILEVLGDE